MWLLCDLPARQDKHPAIGKEGPLHEGVWGYGVPGAVLILLVSVMISVLWVAMFLIHFVFFHLRKQKKLKIKLHA